MATMYLYITNDGDGSVLIDRALGDEESLEPNDYLDEVEALYCGEVEVSREGGYCPLGCCDFTIEIAEEPSTGVCWQSRSYFWKL